MIISNSPKGFINNAFSISIFLSLQVLGNSVRQLSLPLQRISFSHYFATSSWKKSFFCLGKSEDNCTAERDFFLSGSYALLLESKQLGHNIWSLMIREVTTNHSQKPMRGISIVTLSKWCYYVMDLQYCRFTLQAIKETSTRAWRLCNSKCWKQR